MVASTEQPSYAPSAVPMPSTMPTEASAREESQFESEHRTPDESSGASFVPSDCGAPYYTDRAAQLCSYGGFFQWCFVRGASAQHNTD